MENPIVSTACLIIKKKLELEVFRAFAAEAAVAELGISRGAGFGRLSTDGLAAGIGGLAAFAASSGGTASISFGILTSRFDLSLAFVDVALDFLLAAADFNSRFLLSIEKIKSGLVAERAC